MQKGIIIVVGLGAVILVLVAVMLLVPGKTTAPVAPSTPAVPKIPSSNMTLTSPAFEHNGLIPKKFTCDGENINPELLIQNVPAEAKSLALIMDDPDVPKSIRPDGMWVHWLVWNIPPETLAIGEGSNPQGVLGKNTGGENAYGGPCPPDREHRYFFKLYALDTVLDLEEGAAKEALESAMQGHVIAETELIGRYTR